MEAGEASSSHEGGADIRDAWEHVLLDPSAEPRYLPLPLLKDITSNFSHDNRIGCGGFAHVYKGRLRNGTVAVKKLRETLDIDDVIFEREVGSLLGMKHKNIVRILGYCFDTQRKMLAFDGKNVMAEERERLLCFEYLPRGSLDEYIKDASCGLGWLERYAIIRGICSGLHCLHTKHDIAHMDLKPGNILLDDNLVPKIADFGTSRLIDRDKSQIFTENLLGTCGYMAPEYIQCRLISKKADIFSLGVIILELLTGSRPEYPFREGSERLYCNEVVGKWSNRLPKAAYSEQVRMCVLIAIECVSSDKDRRPNTEYIIEKLDEVQDHYGFWSWVKTTTPNVIIGIVAAILILASPSSTCSWVVSTVRVLTALVALLAWKTLFAVGSILAAVLVLLNPSSSWSWVVLALKVLTALVKLLALGFVGLVAASFILNLPNPMRSLFTTGFIQAAVLVLLKTRKSSWSWIATTALDVVVKAPITLSALGVVYIADEYLQDHKTSSVPRAILFAMKVVLATVLGLWRPSISWSSMETGLKTLKVIMTLVDFIAIICAPLHLIYLPLVPKSSWKWAILFAIGAIQGSVFGLLNPSSVWSWVKLVITAPFTFYAIDVMAVLHMLLWAPDNEGALVVLIAIMMVLVAVSIIFAAGILGALVMFSREMQAVILFLWRHTAAALRPRITPNNKMKHA